MDSVLTTIGLPISLGVIMLGLGLGLTTRDFTRLLSMPWTIVLVLGRQIVLLPIVCFGLVLLFVSRFDLSPIDDEAFYGNDYHPNVYEDEKMAAELTAYLRKLMGWF